ncbi:MAG: alpha/beta fold hydrolase [Parvibaculaceae bacterium]
MPHRAEAIHPRRLELAGAHANMLAADLYTAPEAGGRLAVLVHGGGQTRHSWRSAAKAFAREGWSTITLDQRGHGESAWIADAAYGFGDYAADLKAVVEGLERQGFGRAVVVGASLGGIAGMIAAGELGVPMRGLVLVDITPKVRLEGVERVINFMRAHAREGFGSLEEAAASISAYLPHRRPPSDLSGLAKVLRKDKEGRYRWHWDPLFLDSRSGDRGVLEGRLSEAVRRIRFPILMVRGRESELVGEEEARAFLTLAPHAELADVGGARHMVAGDRNDAFTDAVLGFLRRLEPGRDGIADQRD